MFILRNSQWEGSFPVGGEFPGGNIAYRIEGSFPGRGSFPVRRELPSGMIASRWEESFPVGRDLLGRKRTSRGKRASRWERSFQRPSGKGATRSQWAVSGCHASIGYFRPSHMPLTLFLR